MLTKTKHRMTKCVIVPKSKLGGQKSFILEMAVTYAIRNRVLSYS